MNESRRIPTAFRRKADKATEPEKFAAKELAMFLKRVTGAEFSVVAEQSSTDDRANRIYVGWTEYSARRGIDASKLGEEEWVIRTIGDDLVLTGGRPRGTMYAVYEFLEDHVGCHWLDRKTEVIPSKPTLEHDFPYVYWLTQNDVYRAHCECDDCQAIATREGGESGPLISFLNAVAQDIEKDFPNILVGTLAYNLTSTPPRRLRPRNNVLIGWCDVYSKVDGVRPLSHPLNARNYSEITAWGKVAPRLAIGDDYWTALGYYKHFPTPYAMIDCVAKDIKLFADQGAESFFAETADYMDASQQFIPLKFWLGYQLLVDPQQPVEPLIATFMDGYFGAASDSMREYLRYLRKRIDADAQFKKLRDEPHKLAYLGRIRVQEGMIVWALEGGRLGVNIDRVFVPEAKTRAANEWDAYISLKLQGPAYVKGAKDVNGAWMDCVLLVKP